MANINWDEMPIVDVQVKYPALEPKEFTAGQGKRGNVVVDVAPQEVTIGAMTAKIEGQHKIWAGGNDDWQQRELAYLMTLAKGEVVTVKAYISGTEVRFKPIVPQNFSASTPAPAQAQKAPASNPNGESIAGFGQRRVYERLGDTELEVADAMIANKSAIYRRCLAEAKDICEAFGLDFNQHGREMATHFSIDVRVDQLRGKMVAQEWSRTIAPTLETLQRWLRGAADKIRDAAGGQDKPGTSAMQRDVVIVLSKLAGGDDERRYYITECLVGKRSVKELTAAEIQAIQDWAKADKENNYQIAKEALHEVKHLM